MARFLYCCLSLLAVCAEAMQQAMTARRGGSSLVRRADKSAEEGTLEAPRIEAYIISSKCKGKRLPDSLTSFFAAVHCTPAVYVRPGEIQDMLKNGTMDVDYSSFDVPHLPTRNVDQVPRLAHDLGAALAHREAWRSFLQCSNSRMCGKYAMLFEDDALVRDDLADVLTTLRSKLLHIKPDVVLVGHCHEVCPVSTGSRIDLGSGAELVRSRTGLCNHGYLISVDGASRLLRATSPIKHAADEHIKNEYTTGKLNSLSICPSVVTQEGRNWAGKVTTGVGGILSHRLVRRLRRLSKEFALDQETESRFADVLRLAERWERPRYLGQIWTYLNTSKDLSTVPQLLTKLQDIVNGSHKPVAVWTGDNDSKQH